MLKLDFLTIEAFKKISAHRIVEKSLGFKTSKFQEKILRLRQTGARRVNHAPTFHMKLLSTRAFIYRLIFTSLQKMSS